MQYSTVYTTLHYTTLRYTTLHYTTLHYTTLHYTTLHYTTLRFTIAWQFLQQWIVIYPAIRNRNRFAEPTYVWIGIGLVREFHNWQIGIWIIFVRWEVFANNSGIPDISFFPKNFKKNSFSWILYIFHLKNLPGKQSHSEIYSYSLYIFNKRTRYLRILWKIFVNRNNISQINIFANRNNIHEMKLWRIGIEIYSWPKYQQIDFWRIYLRTIHELFANKELFAEHCFTTV